MSVKLALITYGFIGVIFAFGSVGAACIGASVRNAIVWNTAINQCAAAHGDTKQYDVIGEACYATDGNGNFQDPYKRLFLMPVFWPYHR